MGMQMGGNPRSMVTQAIKGPQLTGTPINGSEIKGYPN